MQWSKVPSIVFWSGQHHVRIKICSPLERLSGQGAPPANKSFFCCGCFHYRIYVKVFPEICLNNLQMTLPASASSGIFSRKEISASNFQSSICNSNLHIHICLPPGSPEYIPEANWAAMTSHLQIHLPKNEHHQTRSYLDTFGPWETQETKRPEAHNWFIYFCSIGDPWQTYVRIHTKTKI